VAVNHFPELLVCPSAQRQILPFGVHGSYCPEDGVTALASCCGWKRSSPAWFDQADWSRSYGFNLGSSWIPGTRSMTPMGRLEYADCNMVSELIDHDSHQWIVPLLRKNFMAPDVERIMRIPLRCQVGDDWRL
jgi:hypothetical protein